MMLTRHPFFVALLLILCIQKLHGQDEYVFTPALEQAHTDLQDLKIPRARQALVKLKEPKGKAIKMYLENTGEVLQILIHDDRPLYNVYSTKALERIEAMEKLPPSPYRDFLVAEVRLQWAFAKFNFNDLFSGFWNMRQAFRKIDSNYKRYPDFIPQHKTVGLMKVLIGAIPDEYQWVAKGIGLRGNVSEGIEHFNKVIASKSRFSFEALLYKYMINAYLLDKREQTVPLLHGLKKQRSESLLVTFIWAQLLFDSGKGDLGIKALEFQPKGNDYISFPFLDYMMGEGLLNKGNYADAIPFFKQYLERAMGSNYIKSSHLQLFNCYWLLGIEDMALDHLERINMGGSDHIEADHYAQKFVDERTIPHKVLLKTRHLSDGGYHEMARDTLLTITSADFKLHKDKIEYLYRAGRIYQHLKKMQDAITYFKKSIGEQTDDDKYYFAPNACLQLGKIYAKKNDKAMAQRYFKQAIAYRKHEYESSIETKAKAGLKKLREN